MEILESQDPEKKRLMDEAKRHKEQLANDVKLVSEQTEKVVINALVIGGSLALAYILLNQFSGGGSGKKKKAKTVRVVAQTASASPAEEAEEPLVGQSILAEIGTKVVNEATLFLLNLAKEKLLEYLKSRKD